MRESTELCSLSLSLSLEGGLRLLLPPCLSVAMNSFAQQQHRLAMTTGGAATRKDVTVPLSSATLPSSIPSALSPPPPLPRPRAAQLQAQLAEAVTQAFAGSEARIVAVFEVRREEMREKKRAIDSLSRAKKSSGFALSLSLEGKKKKNSRSSRHPPPRAPPARRVRTRPSPACWP